MSVEPCPKLNDCEGKKWIWLIEPRIPNRTVHILFQITVPSYRVGLEHKQIRFPQKWVKNLTVQSLFGGLLPNRIEYPGHGTFSCFENCTLLWSDLIEVAYGVINGQNYEFPVFTGKITHAQTVCTRPFLLLPLKKGPGDEASQMMDCCSIA